MAWQLFPQGFRGGIASLKLMHQRGRDVGGTESFFKQALDWGLVDELADDGKTVEVALGMADVVASMPATTVRMVKEAVNATAGALHRSSAFADADQSQVTAGLASSKSAREKFKKK